MAALVGRWVRFYTRDLPAPIARRRVEEIDADLHDHIAHDRARGTGERRIALGIASRMVRGLPADASWRRTMTHPSTAKDPMRNSNITRRSALRVGIATACILAVPLVAMQITDEVAWGVADFVLAAVLLAGTGLLLEKLARRPRNVAYSAATTVIGVAAIAFGEADDAPGLVLFGCLLILGTVALAFRTAARST